MKNNFIKFLNKIIELFYSERFLNILILVVSLLLLTGVLSSRYFLFQNVVEDGVSKLDVIASRDVKVEDFEKTEAKKRSETAKVKPVLKPVQEGVNEYIRKNLGELFNSIKVIRESTNNNIVKTTKLRELLSTSEQNYYLNNAIDYLHNASEQEFVKIALESLDTLDKILKEGITEADLFKDKNEIIKNNVSKTLNSRQKTLVTLLVKKVLEPNMVEDKMATELAMQRVANSVPTVETTYKKGDVIVSQGEKIKKVQKQALKELGYNVNKLDLIGIIGIFSLVGLCIFTTVYYLVSFDSKFLKTPYIAMITLLVTLVTTLAVLLPVNTTVYIVPIPALAMLLTIFTSSRVALLVTMLTVVMLGVSLQYSIESIFVFMLGAIIAIFTTNTVNYYRRMDMVRAGFDVGLIQMFVVLAMFLLQNNEDSINLTLMIMNMFLGFANGLLSGIIALGSLPLIESLFKIITHYGLAELADHNQALLRRLQFEAPGTYHHSLMVSNLCETAAEAIEADPVLARVGAFYHDIGKLKRPLFFIENQSYFGIENPHEKLNPRLSKMVISAHPKDGIELAKEYKLPSVIHHFIIQHHGDGLAGYFYKQALETEGPEKVSEEQFRYNNPKPSSKECAILMLADAVESAVRAIKNPTQDEVDELVEKLIHERLIDGQLSECPLTQKDLKIIAGVFKRVLRGMQHHRIKYHENILEELNQKNSKNIKQTQVQLQNDIESKIVHMKKNNEA